MYFVCFVTFNDCAFICSTACVNTALKAVIIVTINTETIANMAGIVVSLLFLQLLLLLKSCATKNNNGLFYTFGMHIYIGISAINSS
jgi:hypothetical protein